MKRGTDGAAFNNAFASEPYRAVVEVFTTDVMNETTLVGFNTVRNLIYNITKANSLPFAAIKVFHQHLGCAQMNLE